MASLTSQYVLEFSLSVDVFDAHTSQFKEVLHCVRGCVHRGELLAIMGPSGSGKTTLLDALSGQSNYVHGEVKVDGKKCTHKTFKQIAYVLQKDLFLPNLTLKETLLFIALLKLGREVSIQKKREKVDQIIRDLGLELCCDTIMGSIDNRGLSGGEKKRASIACELLSDPQLFLLDEPTTGIDSTLALGIVSMLRDLSISKGITVVASIHQPSSELFHSFDTLLALGAGEVVYNGPVCGLVNYMSSINLPSPEYFNSADHLINLSVDESTLECMISNWKRVEIQSNNVNEQVIPFGNKVSRVSCVKNYLRSGHCFFDSNQLWIVQFLVLFLRDFLNYRVVILSKHRLIESFLMGFIVGFAFFQMPHTEAFILSRFGFIFFFCIRLTYSGSVLAASSLLAERDLLNKERASGLYRVSAYYASKLFAELPITVTTPFIMLTISYWLSNVQQIPQDWPLFFALYFWIILILMTATGIGFGISALTADLKTSTNYLALIIFSSLAYAGFYTKRVPYWISWVNYISPLNFSFDIGIMLIFTENMIIECSRNNNSLYKVCNERIVANITGRYAIENHYVQIELPLWGNILMMLLFTTFWLIFGYLSLLHLHRPDTRLTRFQEKAKYKLVRTKHYATQLFINSFRFKALLVYYVGKIFYSTFIGSRTKLMNARSVYMYISR